MNQSEKILEIKDLCVEFKTVEGTVKAINHLNYTLHKGEKLGIVGESGSGKSVSSLGIMQLIRILQVRLSAERFFIRDRIL